MASSLQSITPSTIALGFLCLFLAYLVGASISNYRQLQQFGGPLWAGISRSWLFWQEIMPELTKLNIRP